MVSPPGTKSFNSFRKLHTFFKRKSRESFSDIELLAVPIIGAMIGRGEFGVLFNLSGKQSASEWQADDYRDVLLLRMGEKSFDRLLAKDVEDDLECGEVRLLKAEQGFLHGLDARPETLDFALLLALTQATRKLRPGA